MLKKLFTQIRNEWRANLFLLTELLVVFVILWYIVDWVVVTTRVYMAPMGFDTEHCYNLSLMRLTEKSALYDPSLTAEDDMEAFIEIADRLRHRPGVEEVAISQNSIPYNDGSNGLDLIVDSVDVHAIRRWAQPEFYRLFRIHAVAVLDDDGRTVYTNDPDALARSVSSEGRKIIVSRNVVSKIRYEELGMTDALPLLGRELPLYRPDNEYRVRVSAIAEPLRWSHFQTSEQWGGPFFGTDLPRETIISFENPSYLQLSLRLTPEADTRERFMEELMDDADRLYRIGNVFLLDVQPFDHLQHALEMEDVNEARTQLCVLGFLLLNVFLGVAGTFWFRTQHRRSEVALRMAMGSTRRGIFLRLISEGLLLLTVAAVPALLIAVHIGLAELVDVERLPFDGMRFLQAALLSYGLMALMIVVGIWYPARRAMRVQPAEALHDE